ncbi:MAG: PaaI family thioesterase [Propionibacteriaceae bacterium]
MVEPSRRPDLELAVSVLAAQPFNDLVGAAVTEFGAGAATLELEIDDRHRQQYGLVHGGVFAYLVDNSLTFAAGSVLGAEVVTGGFTVNYLRGAREGTLRAHAEVVHSDHRHAVCTAEVYALTRDGEQRLCAVAQGTIWSTAGAGRPESDPNA